MIGLARDTPKSHARFLGGTIALSIVARNTGSHQVLPRIASATGTRDDVVNRQRCRSRPAVLAGKSISAENVPPGKLHLFVWHADVRMQPNNARIGVRMPHRTDEGTVACFDQLCFVEKQQEQSLADIADQDRLVALVEHQDTSAIERAWRARGGSFAICEGNESV